MRFTDPRPWRRCEALRGFPEAQAVRIWNRAIGRSGSPRVPGGWWVVRVVCLCVLVFGILWVALGSNLRGWLTLPIEAVLALAFVALLGVHEGRYGRPRRFESVRRYVEGGRLIGPDNDCAACGYSLVGLDRWLVGDRSQVTCTECGALHVLGDRDLRVLELLDGDRQHARTSTPSPPSSA